MRRRLIAVFVFFIFILISFSHTVPLDSSHLLKNYYLEHFYSDTGALNCVAGIYLNYRVFDTLFETLLLLISVIGIIHFSRHKGDY